MLSRMSAMLVLGTALLFTPAIASANLVTKDEYKKALAEAKAKQERVRRIKAYRKHTRKFTTAKRFDGQKVKPATGVPELDPKGATSALTLLLGGALVLADRRRRALGASELG